VSSNDLRAASSSGMQMETAGETTDEHLMQAVSRGDLDAFNELVVRYQGPGWRTAYRFVADSMEAEDIAQESFLKILEAAPRYSATASFRTYFYRTLIHLCIDRIRKKKPTATGDIPELADPSRNPEGNLIDKEREYLVRQALEALPSNQKAALILRHYEGLSYAEIARILGTTVKAVERLLARARTSLHTNLAEFE
jgi:RNA polymerase sigma-70 factor, ECF subfamily